jgi:uncharacterized protein YggU (UPF0235/DUF167 family)
MPDLTPCNGCRSDNDGERFTLTLYIQPGAKRTEAVGLHVDALKSSLLLHRWTAQPMLSC